MSDKENIVRCPFVPASLDIPETDIATLLFQGLRRYSTHVAVDDVYSSRSVTFSEIERDSELVARHLLSYGCRKGTVVAIIAPNSIEWILVAVGVMRIGAIPAPVNPLHKADEIYQQLSLCNPEFIYTTAGLMSTVLEAVASIKIREIFVHGGHPRGIDSARLFQEKSNLPALPTIADLQLKPTDMALILFSSGTTGLPKAVAMSHRSIISELIISSTRGSYVLVKEQMIFATFVTIFGYYSWLFCLALGYHLIMLTKFEFPVFLQQAAMNKLTLLLVVPPIVTLLAKSPEVLKYDLSSLKELVCSGAPLSKEIEDQLLERFPLLHIRQAFGMTETSAGVCLMPSLDARLSRGSVTTKKPGSIGVPAYNVEMKVIDIETGASLRSNERGEICVRTPQIMIGYLNNRQSTAETIDKDNWLHTGDIGYYDDDGYFYIVDRLKELIKYNSYQVAPAELEAVLLSHPQIADAGVFGIPDAAAGELPMAWVVKKPNSTITELDVQQYVTDKVAIYKRLRGGVKFVAEIPKTGSGKILRRNMKNSALLGKL